MLRKAENVNLCIKYVYGTQEAIVNFEKQEECKIAKENAGKMLFNVLKMSNQHKLYVDYN